MPYDTPYENHFETMNEYATLVVLYCLLCFTDFVGDKEQRHDTGNTYIWIVCLFGVVHLSTIFMQLLRTSYIYIKRWFLKCIARDTARRNAERAASRVRPFDGQAVRDHVEVPCHSEASESVPEEGLSNVPVAGVEGQRDPELLKGSSIVGLP